MILRFIRNPIFALVAIILFGALPALSQAIPAPPLFPPMVPNSKIAPTSKPEFNYPGPYPKHGVLIAEGNFLSTFAHWTIVDFDTANVTFITTDTQRQADGTLNTIVKNKSSHPLSTAEANTVRTEINHVWSPDPTNPASPPAVITDSTCDVMLYDGDKTKHLMGMACSAKALVQKIKALEPQPSVQQLPPPPLLPDKTKWVLP